MWLTRLFASLFLFIALLTLTGCPKKDVPPPETPDQPPFYHILRQGDARRISREVSPASQGLGSWTAYRDGLEDSLGYLLRRPADAVCVNRPGLTLTWGQLADSVAELMALLPQLDEDPGLLAERFDWLRVSPGTLLTGYYEPWLDASLTPDEVYRYPLYGVPEDLKVADLGKFHQRWKGQRLIYRMGPDGIEPYPDRQAIDGNSALAGKGSEIAWAKDPVDIFFLQIQGSGRLVLPDGSSRHILYGGKNGHRYVSLGRVLIERGLVPKEEMSMQRIRQFLSANPVEALKLMFENPSYVFFRLSDDGPYGSINSILTPWVSVAVDPSMIPLGSACVLSTELADAETGEKRPFKGLVLPQDTGGAIQGTRMDLFCGSTPGAEHLAGHLQERSEVFLLVSRQVTQTAQPAAK